ncbi:MAG: hypothetical protein ACK559_29955 [bacterium]
MEAMQEGTQKLRNPYIDLYHWVKGEIYDLNSIKEVIAAWLQVVDNKRYLEEKQRKN